MQMNQNLLITKGEGFKICVFYMGKVEIPVCRWIFWSLKFYAIIVSLGSTKEITALHVNISGRGRLSLRKYF